MFHSLSKVKKKKFSLNDIFIDSNYNSKNTCIGVLFDTLKRAIKCGQKVCELNNPPILHRE